MVKKLRFRAVLPKDKFGVPEGKYIAPELKRPAPEKRKAPQNRPKETEKRARATKKKGTVKNEEGEVPAEVKSDKPKPMRLTRSHPVPTVDELLGSDNYHAWWLEVEMDKVNFSQMPGDDDDDDDDNESKDPTTWETLEHNGLMFDEPYTPHGVPLVYEGKKVALAPVEEEAATMFAMELHTPYAQDETFCRNFWADFQAVLNRDTKYARDRHAVQLFKDADFGLIWKHLMKVRQEKALVSKADKAVVAEQAKAMRAEYGWATIDGMKVEVGPWRVEASHLYKGRGDHPKRGCITDRVTPDMVTLNLDEEHAQAPPTPNIGGEWGEVVSNHEVLWLAAYKTMAGGNAKYMRPGNTSPQKGRNDLIKFNLARALTLRIDELRRGVTQLMAPSEPLDKRQMAVVIHMIDRLAIRAGGKKDTSTSADTVGACNLRVEHVTLDAATRMVTLDFLGKDSIRYTREVEFAPDAFAVFVASVAGKEPTDLLWAGSTHTSVNRYLTSFMSGLTLKVLRTFNACVLFDRLLYEVPGQAKGGDPATLSEPDLKLWYSLANREVAVMCNHQRAESKGHGASMAAAREKIDTKRAELTEAEELVRGVVAWTVKSYSETAIDKEVVGVSEAMEIDINAIEKGKMGAAAKKAAKTAFVKKNKDGDEIRFDPSAKQAVAKIRTLANRRLTLIRSIERLEGQATEREELKTTALGTSRLNYLDPRITAAWCRRGGCPITRVFNKTLLTKFPWALDVPADWRFRPESG